MSAPLLLIIVVLAGSPDGRAAENAETRSPALSIEQVVERAVEANPAVHEAQLRQEAAENRGRSARGGFFPSLGLTASALTVSGTPLVVDGNVIPARQSVEFLGSARLQQNLFSGGGVLNAWRQAREMSDAARAHSRLTRQTIQARAREACYESLRANALLTAAREATRTALEHRRDVEARVRAGLTPQVDSIRAEVRVKQAQLAELEKLSREKLAGARLAAVLALPPSEAPPRVEGTLPEVPTPAAPTATAPQNLAPLIAGAVERRSDLAAFRAEAQAVDYGARVTSARLLPQLDAFAAWNHFQASGWQAGLVLSWELFSGGSTYYARGAERALAHAAEEKLRVQEQQAAVEVREATLDVETSIEGAGLASARVELAREDLRLTRLRFQQGAATNIEVIDAQTRESDAAAALINARADFAVGQSRLRLASGEE